MNTPIAIVQCRLGSTRLPEKVLLPFHQDQTILALVMERVTDVFGAERTILATTTSPQDDRIAEWCEGAQVRVFRGDELDVMQRFVDACRELPEAEYFCRVCADNPFLCRDGLQQFRDTTSAGNFAYASYAFQDGTPSILSHCGLYAEMVHSETFATVAQTTDLQRHREHITTFFLDNPQAYERRFLQVPKMIQDCPILRLTVDSKADFDNTSKLYGTLEEQHGPRFTTAQLLDEVLSRDDYRLVMQQEIENNEKK